MEHCVPAERSRQPPGHPQFHTRAPPYLAGEERGATACAGAAPATPAQGLQRAPLPDPAGARSCARRRQAAGWAAARSPRGALPAPAELPKFESGSLVSSGYSLHLQGEPRKGQPPKPSLPFPLPPPAPPHLRPPTPDEATPGCVVIRPLWGVLPYVSSILQRYI